MSARHIIRLAALPLAMAAAHAQQAQPAEGAATAPAEMPCMQQKRHDHGADRNMPMPQGGCKQVKAETKKAAKPAKGHDHAKTHKLM